MERRLEKIRSTVGIVMFGTSHHFANIKMREQYIRTLGDYGNVPKKLFKFYSEMIILATCNRAEVYFAYDTKRYSQRAVRSQVENYLKNEFLGASRKVVYIRFNDDAVVHLYRVSSGVDSIVVGETEILTQVKEARLVALKLNMCGKVLNRIFIRAKKFGSEIRMRTPISRGVTSVTNLVLSSLATTHDLTETRVLLYGAGKMGKKMAILFAQKYPAKLVIINRTRPRAIEVQNAIVREHKNNKVEIGNPKQLSMFLLEAHVVVAATSAKVPVFTASMIPDSLRNVVFVDLGVPRNVDPEIQNDKKGIRVMNIDHFQEIADQALSSRKALIPNILLEINKDITLLSL